MQARALQARALQSAEYALRVLRPRLAAAAVLLLLAALTVLGSLLALAAPSWGSRLASWSWRKLGGGASREPASESQTGRRTQPDEPERPPQVGDLASALANLGMPKRKSLSLATQAVESAGQDFDAALRWALANKAA